MSKMRVLLIGATAAGAFAAASFIPAYAHTGDDTPPIAVTGVGELHLHGDADAPQNGGAIIADGDNALPDPLDGSATISGNPMAPQDGSICTSDDGFNPDDSPKEDNPATPADDSLPSNTCNEDIILGYIGM